MNYNEMMQSDNESQPSIYDETAQRIEAAYKAFRAGYEVMKPPPKEPLLPPQPISAPKPSVEDKPIETPFWGHKQWGMIAGLIGSVIVSASHTIPVFLGLDSISDINLLSIEFIIGLSIFVMIEMSVIVFAYSATESEGNSDTAHRVKSFTRGGMWFIVTIAILANVYYVLAANIAIPTEGFMAVSWGWIRVTIFLLIGTSAPVIAFMTGDILAVDILKHRAKIRRDMQAWEEKLNRDFEAWEAKKNEELVDWETKCEIILNKYDERLNQWNEGLHAAWSTQKKRWGASVDIQVSKPEVKQLETVSNSFKQQDYSQTLTQKTAMQYIQEKAEQYKAIAKTVREQNPTANQRDIAMAIAEEMTGDARGYMTVIRAYKKLNVEME
jgi:hypothetical protein